MDMDMGGMDMGVNMFQTTNIAYAKAYWYIVAGVLGAFCVVRAVNYYQRRSRLRNCSHGSREFPAKPSNRPLQIWATLTAVMREVTYPQIYVPYRHLSWLTPPSTGRLLVLVIYWVVIIYMMTAGAIDTDVWYWERIGFRNAWVTVTQLPLLYLLASKSSLLAFITGSSHERLNWLHRWVARTMFVTASVHGWHFWKEWALADFVETQLEMMPMVRYGLGAWAILLWSFLVGFAPLRRLCYELFVVQHIVSAALFLWLLYVHVPVYARYNIWFAIAAFSFDRAVRLGHAAWLNVRIRPSRGGCKAQKRFGHTAQIRAVGDCTTVVTIKDVHSSWSAGQHLYLWMPALGLLEAHPYTIAVPHRVPETCVCNSVQLVVRKHAGFSARLHDRATKMQQEGKKETFTAIVLGPYGSPPRWDEFDTLVLLSASTGASFTLPILESVLRTTRKMCTRRVDVMVCSRQGEEISFYMRRLQEAMPKARELGIQLEVLVAVTQGDGLDSLGLDSVPGQVHVADQDGDDSSSSADSSGVAKEKGGLLDVERSVCCSSGQARGRLSSDSIIRLSAQRPNIAAFIRNPVEAAGGETSVVVCGGPSLVARTRNCVARLSDERAVHKGTGAQGIHLHVEEYSF